MDEIFKTLMPFLFVAAVMKMIAAFMPRKRRRNRQRGGRHVASKYSGPVPFISEKKTHDRPIRSRLHIIRDKQTTSRPQMQFSMPKGESFSPSHDEEAAFIGSEGEKCVAKQLRELADETGCIAINNLMLTDHTGMTTQVDHVVVSRYGIFVIETKTMKGWIFGAAGDRMWTQSLAKGRQTEKYRFQNPLHQNQRHIHVLSERLGVPEAYFASVVVFVGAYEFKTQMPDNVVDVWALVSYLESFTTPKIKDGQLAEIATAIREWDAFVTLEQRMGHVENLRRIHG